MKHLATFESVGERLFKELDDKQFSLVVGDPYRLWVYKPWPKSLIVHRAKGLIGTDPVPLKQAIKYLDLACDAVGSKPVDAGVIVSFVFSLPRRPGEHFIIEGLGDWRLEFFPPDYDALEFLKLKRTLSEMNADIVMVSIKKKRKKVLFDSNRGVNHIRPTKISMYFLEDNWVQLEFDGSVRVGNRSMLITKTYRCDELVGVGQCLDSLNIDP